MKVARRHSHSHSHPDHRRKINDGKIREERQTMYISEMTTATQYIGQILLQCQVEIVPIPHFF
jgi:hypothetical protein